MSDDFATAENLEVLRELRTAVAALRSIQAPSPAPSVLAPGPPVGTVTDREHMTALLGELEKRMLDRFEASDKGVAAALAAAEKAVAAALAAAEKANDKSEAAQGNVNATQNEFRGSLKDQAATLMPRAETETLISTLRDILAGIQKAQAELVPRVEMNNLVRELRDLIASKDKAAIDRTDASDARISALENFRSRATGIGIVLVIFAGVVGAAIAKALGG